MIELLIKGTKVKVHPLEWFEKNYKYIANDGMYDYYSIHGDLDFLFASDMKRFCGEYVTIDNYKVSLSNKLTIFKIKEDNGIRGWISDFFDLSTISNVYIDKVKEYCNNFCVFEHKCKLDMVECSLKNNVLTYYDYNESIVKYKVRVHSLEWFEKNCTKKFDNTYSLFGTEFCFSKEMQEFCGKYVTIKRFIREFNDEYVMKLENDFGSKNWVTSFFEIFNYGRYSKLISNYCDNCILNDGDKCSNLECPLYSK